MSFIPLKVVEGIPPEVSSLVENQIKMQFEDIHVMLRLPVQEEGLDAGCNFAAGNSLLALVSGLSALLTPTFDTSGASRCKFKEMMKNYYPWDLQPPENDTTPHGIDGCIDHLYGQFRNPLAHSLGIKVQGNYYVEVQKSPLTEFQIEKLESRTSSPGSAVTYSPPIDNGRGVETIILNVPNFYWGVRETLYRMTQNKSLMEYIQSNLKREAS